MIVELLSQITPEQLASIAAGFFFIMWLAALRHRRPKQRKWYKTEIPSTLVIETEA